MSRILNACLVCLPFALLSWVPSCVDGAPALPEYETPPVIAPLDTECDDDYPGATPDAREPEIDSGFRCPPTHTDTTCPTHCCLPGV